MTGTGTGTVTGTRTTGGDYNSSFALRAVELKMKMIQSKMKGLEWSQHFSHYKSMGIFQKRKGS